MKGTMIAVATLCAFLFSCHPYERPGNNREIILTNLAPAPIGPYSQAVKKGGRLYVSGQIGLKPDGSFDSTSIESECRQTLNNIKAIVEASGLHMKDVCKSTIYLTDLKNFSKLNEVYKTYFYEAPPARETVCVKALPRGAHIEISVMAEDSLNQ